MPNSVATSENTIVGSRKWIGDTRQNLQVLLIAISFEMDFEREFELMMIAKNSSLIPVKVASFDSGSQKCFEGLLDVSYTSIQRDADMVLC